MASDNTGYDTNADFSGGGFGDVGEGFADYSAETTADPAWGGWSGAGGGADWGADEKQSTADASAEVQGADWGATEDVNDDLPPEMSPDAVSPPTQAAAWPGVRVSGGGGGVFNTLSTLCGFQGAAYVPPPSGPTDETLIFQSTYVNYVLARYVHPCATLLPGIAKCSNLS